MACNVIPSLTSVAENTPHVTALCMLLERFAKDPDSRLMLCDPELFRSLSKRTILKTHLHSVINVIVAAKLFGSPSVIDSVVYQCTSIFAYDYGPTLFNTHASQNDPILKSALELLECCAALSCWKSSLVPWMVEVSTTGWPLEMGRLLSVMLSGTSVEFVLAMHSHGKLSSLIRRAQDHMQKNVGDLTWRAVRASLKRHWPAQVSLALGNELEVKNGGAATTVTCPITLQECVHPVVASDGNTYERDALMKHMSNNRNVLSPLTKEPLEYHLFDNRAIL